MQKKTDKFFDKIVKRDYNNELEKVLEKKYFDENTKNLLLNILYKVEVAYPDYEKVKPDVETKEEFIQTIIENIQNDCEDIKIVKLNSKESEMLGNKTFLVEKDKKRIVCYPIERKLLYCIAKIGKNKKIIKDQYHILDNTLSDLINVGSSINTVETMRDFNGYSWTTIPREIESIYHNLAYQNIRILVGEKFLNQWIQHKEYIMDYLEAFQNRLEKQYGETNAKKFLNVIDKLSVLLAIQYDSKTKRILEKEKKENDLKLEEVKDNEKFVQKITKEKKTLTKEIKKIDATINDKAMLQEEYEKRNEFLPLKQKIFSIRILSKIMMKEREEKITRLEELNALLNPQKFIQYKKELENKDHYLKLLEIKEVEIELKKIILKLQNIFLSCYQEKIAKIGSKQEVMKLIYEFRYYCLLPFNEEVMIGQIKEIEKQRKEIEMLLIQKAQEWKLIDHFSTEKEIEYEILKNIFNVRVINLEDLSIKIVKEQNKYYVQLFDDTAFEEKIPMKDIENLDKKKIVLKLNKKIKIFN